MYRSTKELGIIFLNAKNSNQSPMNKHMSTKKLRTNIDKAINNLIPLFKVTEEELKRFKRPGIRRILKPSEYPEHSRKIPAYSAFDNWIYFPLVNSFPIFGGVFGQASIHHEVGHYIHYFINSSCIKGIFTCSKTGERPLGHARLSELVAEYANFILGLREYDDYLVNCVFKKSKQVYDKHGPEFLPKLARMTLEEVINEGIIKV